MSLARNLRLYRKWWKTWKTLPVFSWLRAASLFKVGKYEQAIQLYESGLARHPNHPAEVCARLDLAYCLFRIGRFQQAECELQYVAGRNPDSREAQLRLAHFQLWTGRPLEAAWTMRRALRRMKPDTETVATFMLAVVEAGAPGYLMQEALDLSLKLERNSQAETRDASSAHRLQVARARFRMERDEYEEGRTQIATLACLTKGSVEAIVSFAEILIGEDKVVFARQQLRRGLAVVPNHPRILSLLAESYLCDGPFQNGEYALQLASTACQTSGWMSPREMHILAEAYYRTGDKMSALLMASKARQAGSRLLGAYRHVKSLDKLIENLSTGTLA